MIGRRALARLLDAGAAVVALLLGAPGPVVLVIYWLYETLLTARTGQTVGKRLVAIRVVSARDRPPDLGRSAVRSLPILLLAVPYLWVLCPVAYLWAIQPERRGLHDLVAGTRVVGERWLVGSKPPGPRGG